MKLYRKRAGKGFKYYNGNGRLVADRAVLERINAARIPPAYKDVEINLANNAKIFATGIDDAGRKQYIYNTHWVEHRDKQKFCDLIDFGKQLPKIEQKMNKDLKSTGLTKKKLIALILRIMQTCNFRVGTEKCKNTYNSFGITTIQKKHVKVGNSSVQVEFIGKKGVPNACTISSPQLVKILREIDRIQKNGNQTTPFFTLKSGKKGEEDITVSADDINEYLKEFGPFTSKYFRTWEANRRFLEKTKEREMGNSPTARTKAVREMVKEVAAELHHTPAVCRKSYLHGDLLDMYINDPPKFKKARNDFVGFLEKASYCRRGAKK